MTELIGQKVGQYEILSLIGRGGMSSVYRARQTTVQRDVAIKVLSERYQEGAPFLDRFEREVRIIAGLEHIHILPIYDYGQYDGFPYLVMRFLDGGSLNTRIGGRALPLPEIERLMGQICAALDFAHDHDVVHRDMKPHNVLLDRQGNAYICDFGIAKQIGGEGGLTQTGQAVGTPNYMAPEQWQGLAVDRRTDVYALGVILYEMLTGGPPFPGDNIFSMMYKHLNEPPPLPSMRRSDIPPALDLVVQQAMEKLPSDRYDTAGGMARAISAALRLGASPLVVSASTTQAMPIPAGDEEPTDILIRGGATFAGRTWVLKAFGQWCNAPDESPIFFLVGPHGIGKSTLVSRFIEMLGERVLRYELAASMARSLDPRAFVRALSEQLAEVLPGSQLESAGHVLEDPVTAFEQHILNPLSQETEPIYLAIDSLELAYDHPGTTITDLIRAAMMNWPEALRLIVTAAPDTPLDALFRKAHRLELSPDSDLNRADLRSTLSTRFATLLPNLSAGEVDLMALEEKAQGNPLYLNTVLEHLLFKRLTPADLAALPAGLEALYSYLIDRAGEGALDVLQVIAAARAPLTVKLAAEIMRLPVAEMGSRLAALRPLIINSGASWTLAHPALRHMLLLADDISEAHLRIAAALEDTASAHMDDYALQYLPAHLLLGGQPERAFNLLADLNFLIARLARLAPGEAADDIELLRAALNSDPRLGALDNLAKALHSALSLDTDDSGVLFGHLYNTLVSVAALRPALERAADNFRAPWLRLAWPIQAAPEWSLIWQGAPFLRIVAAADTVLAVCGDGHARLWRGEGFERVQEWNPHAAEALRACALSADGALALTASEDGTARLWRLDEGAGVHVWADHRHAVTDCALSSDGARALTASDDRLLRLWDTESGKLLAAFYEHPEAVKCCAFADGDQVALSGCADGLVRIWNIARNRLRATLEAHRGSVVACCGVPGERLALTGGADGQVCAWDVRAGTLIKSLRASAAVASLAVVKRSGQHIVAAACEDGSTYLWELASGELLAIFDGHAVCVAGERVITGSRDGALRAWALPDSPGQAVEAHGAEIRACAFTPDGRRVITASSDREIRIWDAESGRTLAVIRGHTGPINGLSTDGVSILSASGDKTLRLWDAHRGTMLRMYTGHLDPVLACALQTRPVKVGGRAIRLAASGSSDRTLRIWDADSGQSVMILKGHRDAVTGCAFSPGDEIIVSISKDRTLRLWSLETGNVVKISEDAAFNTCAFSPDGRAVIAGLDDGQLWTLERASGSVAKHPTGIGAGVTACSYSPNGRHVFATFRNGAVCVWDAQKMGAALARYYALTPLTCGAFGPDSASLAVGDSAGSLYVYRIEGLARRKTSLI